MTRREKRIQRMRHNPKAVTFEQLCHLLEDYGFTMRSSKGSHRVFRAEVEGRTWTLTVPFKRGLLDPTYVRKILRVIDEVITWLEDNDE